MIHEDLVLTVDLGSGGPKVGYTTVTGEPVWTWHERSDAWASAMTQDAQQWWAAVVAAARRGIAEGAVDGARVVAVAVTGQWASTVPVDERDIPVAPCLMWSDTSGGALSRERFGGPFFGYGATPLRTWLRRSGGIPSTYGADPIAHMLHLQQERPDLRPRWVLEPVDYLTMRFTGIAAASPMSMIAAWLTDNRDLSRVGYDPVLVAMAGVREDRLPPLRPSGSVIGTVQPEVAAELGIPSTAQVVTGLPDLHASALGTGSIGVGQGHCVLGTSSWICAPITRKRSDLIRMMASVPGIGDGHYLIANNQDNAGRALEWFRDAMAPNLPLTELLAAAEQAPVGSKGVIFTPWLTGERTPVEDRNARGGFTNLSLSIGRPELTRAVLEGISLNLGWLLQGVEAMADGRLDPIRIAGGGARSNLWCQIVADVTGRRIERVEEPLYAGLRGAGLAAGLALGAIRHDEVRAAVPVETTFDPDPAAQGLYRRLAAEFPKLYRRNRRMFARLNGAGSAGDGQPQ